MTKHKAPDPLVAEIEHALTPGQFIQYGDIFEFVQDLEKIHKKLAALVDGEKAKRAVPLYEVLLSGCYEKMEECDDSGGNMGMFWDELFCGWVKARQKAGCPAAETVEQILRWKENDDYGLCYDIEKAVVKMLDREGYRLFVGHFHSVVDKALANLNDRQTRPIFKYENDIRLPAMSLKGIYRAKGDSKSYAALCERLGMSPQDCEHLAEMEMTKGHWDRALAWVEKGLALESTRNWHNESSPSLAHVKPKILGKLGRKKEALAMAWGDFEKYPSDFAYEEFMQYVPKEERAQWHERAMEAAAAGDVGRFMDLCVKTGEWERLAVRIRASGHSELEEVSHCHSEPAADGLAKRHIPAAAKVYRALGIRILNSKKSKYYDNALRHFRSARDLYRKAGLDSEWQATVEAVRAGHSKKYGFMPGFELIVAGESADRPSFAERARARWARQTQEETE